MRIISPTSKTAVMVVGQQPHQIMVGRSGNAAKDHYYSLRVLLTQSCLINLLVLCMTTECTVLATMQMSGWSITVLQFFVAEKHTLRGRCDGSVASAVIVRRGGNGQ